MKKVFLTFLILAIIPQLSFAKTYRILLTDKGGGEFSIGSEKYLLAKNSLTQKCLDRREKNGIPNNQLISFADVPVYQNYIEQLEQIGVKILLKLKWYNYVVADCDSATLELVKSLPFVKKIIDTDEKPLHLETLSINNTQDAEDLVLNVDYGYESGYYGYSYGQLNELNATVLHSLGINGTGILLGLSDNGFKWKSNPYLSSSNVIGEWDYVYGDSVTENQDNDIGGQDWHGSIVFSSIAAIEPDSLIGVAPKADFILAKTEDNRSELHIEEDNYAAAVEWHESLGADLISTSLGYRDLTINPYSFDELDGESCIASQYLNIASKLGMLCHAAMGNSGPRDSTLLTPADSKYAISIGAMKSDSLVVADFSSRGPNKSNQIKPDLCARGVSVFCINPANGLIIPANGTSVACPIAAGASALLLSAAPYLTRDEALKILKQSASNHDAPNNSIGWGRPDLWKAVKATKTAAGELMYYNCGGYKRFVINIISNYYTASNYIYIRFAGNNEFEKLPLKLIDGQYLFAADIKLEKFNGKAAEVYIESIFEPIVLRKPIAQNKFYLVEPDSEIIPFGVVQSKLPILSSDIAENENISVRIFPSLISGPDNDFFVEFASKNSGMMNISILDIAGREIINNSWWCFNGGTMQRKIDISNLTNGLYFVHFRINESQSFQKLIISK